MVSLWAIMAVVSVVLRMHGADSAIIDDMERECQSDTDCSLSNGQCYNQSTRWATPRCGCGVDHWLDETQYFRCTPTTSVTVVNRTSVPLYYRGQNWTFPSIWRCASNYCTATVGTKAQLGVARSNALVINGTELDPGRVRVRCLAGYRYAAAVNEKLENQCVLCADACAPHGSCLSNSTKQCGCATGWKGPDCRLSVSVAGQAWDSFVYTDTETYQATRSCRLHSQCGASEKCFVRLDSIQPGKGFCWCDQGTSPFSLTSCGIVSSGVASSPFGVDVFWPVPMALTMVTADSRQVWYSPINATAARGNFVGTAYTELPALDDPLYYLVTTQHLHAFYCANESLYFWNATLDPFGLPSRHCQGCAAVCGPYANCSLSNATTGTCVCLAGYTGTFCDRETPLNTTCAAATCYAKGTCLLRSPPASPSQTCACIDEWSGSNCTVYAPACALDQCGGLGTCVVDTSYCTCTAGAYGPDCALNATQCRDTRCSGQGNCTTSLQGCTCDPYYSDYACSTKECVESTLNTTSGDCVCSAGRNGTHCENLICSGHGTYNATSLQCKCDTLYNLPRCATSQCGPNGTVIQVQTNNVTRSVCDCTAPYVADTLYNLTRCTLVCVRGTYNNETRACACGTLRYYGLRCELERSIPPDPRTEFDWTYQSYLVLCLTLTLLIGVDLFYLIPTQLQYPRPRIATRVHMISADGVEQRRQAALQLADRKSVV